MHWYSLTICRAWTATTRHKEAEGSAYYRHYYMGLMREDGSPKPAAEAFPGPWESASGSTMRTIAWSRVEWLRRLGSEVLAHGRELGGLVSRRFREVV